MKIEYLFTNESGIQLFKKIFLLCTFFIFGYSFAQTYNSVSLHSSIDKVQPMTGIVFWSDNSSDLNSLGNKVQLEYSYLVYSDVIQNEGQYNWTSVDNLLAQVASNGRQAILRFRYTYPGVTTPSVPNYIRNSSGYTDQYENVEGSNTYIPDWSSQELQDFTLEFFTEFANRYDNDPRLAYVQVGFGSYAEYHLYSGPLRFGETFPTKTYQTTFLQHVNSVFNETQWSVSIDAGSDQYTPIADSNSLLSLGYGLFDDSFLHESHSTSNSEYNRSLWLTFGADRADNYAAGGELNYYSQWDQEHVLDVAGPYGFTFEEMSEMYDITYMIGNDQLNYQSASRIEDAGMATGYKFEVTEYTSNGSSTQLTIKNNGIAPIYYDAYPTVNGVKSSTSLKGLIAGQSRSFTINTGASGEDLTISCDRLVPGQEIQFDANIDGGTVTNTLTVSTPSTFSADGETKSITVTSNVSWSASESSSWINLNTNSGSNNGTINVTASANTSTSSRSATITISGGGITRNITISQAAADVVASCDGLNAFDVIQAENFCDQSGIQTGTENNRVGWVNNGDWVLYENIDFGSGAGSFSTSVSSGSTGGAIEVRNGSTSGEVLATINVPNTGAWTTWNTITVDTTKEISGELDIYLVFTGGNGFLLDIDWFQFIASETTTSFIPDPNKTYYIDVPVHNLRLAANGDDEFPYTTGTNTIGSDVEWQFVAKGNGSWHIQRAAGGSLPRLRTDNNTSLDGTAADMQGTAWSGTYTYFNFQEGATAGTYFITLTDGPAAHVRLQVDNSGTVQMVGNTSNGTWESFKITEVNKQDTTESCTAGTNLALNGTIVDFSSEQDTARGVNNILDGNDGNRWSASGFPQYAVIDLGGIYSVDQINLMPYSDRAYQFLVEGSTSSATSGYSTLTNATGNTSGGSQINRTFNAQTVRYIRLTITGASGYTGTWSSVEDFEIICTGSTNNKDLFSEDYNLVDISAYPSPFNESITIRSDNNYQTMSKIQLIDLTGKIISNQNIDEDESVINKLENLASGMYLLQIFNTNNQIIKIIKMLKE